jgi:NAD(P)H-hydrate repair Nnr-like enzyme with NAD(P)H-hydrate dehydratase domain
VLKGPQTFICVPCAPQVVFRENFATPALAKAGTGDILAGIIASFLAQGQSVKGAAILGVGAHSLAGRAAEQKFGTISVAPEDVIASLPEVFMQNIN